MDEVPPPTEHILRPHHIGLLSILSLAFRDTDSKNFPNPFTLHLYRCLLNEISEVCEAYPANYMVNHISRFRSANQKHIMKSSERSPRVGERKQTYVKLFLRVRELW